MTRKPPQKRTSAITHTILAGAVSAIFLASAFAQGPDRQGLLTEEFHQTYPLSAQGRVEIDNLNGGVHITGWDRDEVKVDAVKTAWTKERLNEARMDVSAEAGKVSIRTKFREHNRTFNFGGDDERNNPASVEYTITVPRQARLEEIKMINGRLDVQDVSGPIRASCINGRIQAKDLEGAIELNTVNGELDANVSHLPSSEMKLSSVNGRVRLTLPSDASAELEATTVHGNISDEFGLAVTHHQFVGRSLHGELAGGGTLVKLSNVNGAIEIRHAADNRPVSPARNLEEKRRGRDIGFNIDNSNDD